MHGDPLLEVSCATPDDVRILRDALVRIEQTVGEKVPLILDLGNDGTAVRFLTAYTAFLPGRQIVLTGSARMRQRPIAPLVNALRKAGAQIRYMENPDSLPISVSGVSLPQNLPPIDVDGTLSTQFVSALLLAGVPVRTATQSPYIDLTRTMIARYTPLLPVEADWASAAFWYEYVALHGGALLLEGLKEDSLQADKAVASVFGRMGVDTQFTQDGCAVCRTDRPLPSFLQIDFASCPDVYPAAAMTCSRLGISLEATGTERLAYKESDRLQSVAALLRTPRGGVAQTFDDHRIAMAALAADLRIDNSQCIHKSYPLFLEQLCNIRV